MTEQDAADAIALMAACITCDREFIAVIRDAKPELRQSVYEQIKPFLPYVPRKFEDMNFDYDS